MKADVAEGRWRSRNAYLTRYPVQLGAILSEECAEISQMRAKHRVSDLLLVTEPRDGELRAS